MRMKWSCIFPQLKLPGAVLQKHPNPESSLFGNHGNFTKETELFQILRQEIRKNISVIQALVKDLGRHYPAVTVISHMTFTAEVILCPKLHVHLRFQH